MTLQGTEQFDDTTLNAHFIALSLDLFAVANQDGYLIHLNPAWEHALGYTREELCARPYVDFVHPDDRNATVHEQEALIEGKSVLNFENRYKAKDGSWKWLAWKAAPQPGAIVFAVARDISEQKEERQQLQALMQRLERVNHELDQFAHVVSHDLKSPLRAVMSLSEFIIEDLGENVSPEVQAHVSMLKDRVFGMNRMIEALLEFARASHHHSPAEPIDLDALLAGILPGLSRPASFQVHLPEHFQPVRGWWVELVQLFQNLLANSIKYRAADNGFVRITQSLQGAHWLFRVEDNGIGIAARYQDRVFQLFQRGAQEGEVEGTGLGLALVKKIVNAAGGQVSLESEEGKGTTVQFSWPV